MSKSNNKHENSYKIPTQYQTQYFPNQNQPLVLALNKPFIISVPNVSVANIGQTVLTANISILNTTPNSQTTDYGFYYCVMRENKSITNGFQLMSAQIFNTIFIYPFRAVVVDEEVLPGIYTYEVILIPIFDLSLLSYSVVVQTIGKTYKRPKNNYLLPLIRSNQSFQPLTSLSVPFQPADDNIKTFKLPLKCVNVEGESGDVIISGFCGINLETLSAPSDSFTLFCNILRDGQTITNGPQNLCSGFQALTVYFTRVTLLNCPINVVDKNVLRGKHTYSVLLTIHRYGYLNGQARFYITDSVYAKSLSGVSISSKQSRPSELSESKTQIEPILRVYFLQSFRSSINTNTITFVNNIPIKFTINNVCVKKGIIPIITGSLSIESPVFINLLYTVILQYNIFRDNQTIINGERALLTYTPSVWPLMLIASISYVDVDVLPGKHDYTITITNLTTPSDDLVTENYSFRVEA